MIAGIILAAGDSSRMGRPKALLGHEEGTFLASACRNMRLAGVQDILVVLGRQASEVLGTWERCNATVVINHRPEGGMISSLRAALAKLPLEPQPEAVLLALVDMPFVRPETCRALVSAWKTHKGSVVIPRYKGKRGHPIVLDSRVLPLCRLGPEDLGLHWVTHREDVSVVDLEVDDPGVVRDVDTPDDVERFSKEPKV